MSWFVSAVGRFPWWGWALSSCFIGGGLILALGYDNRPRPVDRGFKNVFDLYGSGARTHVQIEAILGPPGDYSTRDRKYIGFISGMPPSGHPVIWKDDYAIIEVYFDRDGRMYYWGGSTVIPEQASWDERRWHFFFDR